MIPMSASPGPVANGPIVVGITGPGCEPAALRFAADCARREGAEVVLAHAFHSTGSVAPTSVLISYAEAADVAQWVVKEVAEEFEELTGGAVAFRTVWAGGIPARVLADLSRGARLVVVQHRCEHPLARVFVGSTAYGVAAHAECPVVSVNPDWQPASTMGEVVVGVHEAGASRDVLEAAFAWAAATSAPVRVVHAWRLDAVYDDVVTGRVAEWRDEQKRALGMATAGLRERYPAVDVMFEVRHQRPADVLVDDSRVASLVVVGRHASRSWAPPRLGSLARMLLREGKSPVMVVPVSRTAGTDAALTADDASPRG
jgi:nucleotide-binding universal stress UspA family protein